MVKKVLQLSGMHCTSCSLVIEGELEDAGVKAEADYVKQKVVVEFDPHSITPSQVQKIIEDQGYKVVGGLE